MNTSSAPGKIILFGEHAVVYGRPALAVPVTQVQAEAVVSKTDSVANSRTGTDSGRGEIWIDAPDIGLHDKLSRLTPNHPLAAVVSVALAALEIKSPPPLTVQIHSTIPVASGLGSGAAVSVAVIRALSAFFSRTLSDDHVSALAFEVERLHHGTPSGIDNTVITYGKPVYFVKDQPIEIFHAGSPLTFVIADTGISAPTKESVGDVRKLWEEDKTRLESIFDSIGKVVNLARENIEKGETAGLGALMDQNHTLLQDLTVSSPELNRLVEAARRSGALGAKLSGGGRGGNMIALVQKENAPAVAKALKSAGARRTIVTTVQ